MVSDHILELFDANFCTFTSENNMLENEKTSFYSRWNISGTLSKSICFQQFTEY